jgi:SAM-dependent methyltransferase
MAMSARDGGSRVALGRTEALPFPGASLDLVTAFNSFHWFVPAAALAEVDRVLRPDGLFAVVWNDWDLGDDFTREFVALMRSAAGDYPEENREAEVAPLYDCRRFAAIEHRGFAYRHRLDREGLQARLQSMSYVPVAGEAASRMLAELEGLHAAFADEAGFVEHRYVSAVYAARR